MGVNYFLFKVSSDFLAISPSQRLSQLTEEHALPFGSSADVVEGLRSKPGFKRDFQADETYLKFRQESERKELTVRGQPFPPFVALNYRYPHISNRGRVVSYSLQDDPVICLSTNYAYVEDFWPVVHAFGDFKLFLVLSPRGELTNPANFKYGFDAWMQKNYEEDELSFRYE